LIIIITTIKPEDWNLLISADTIVVVDGDILDKPINEMDAITMMRRLSGRTHSVLTAVVFYYYDQSRLNWK
jgi:septum formation protein